MTNQTQPQTSQTQTGTQTGGQPLPTKTAMMPTNTPLPQNKPVIQPSSSTPSSTPQHSHPTSSTKMEPPQNAPTSDPQQPPATAPIPEAETIDSQLVSQQINQAPINLGPSEAGPQIKRETIPKTLVEPKTPPPESSQPTASTTSPQQNTLEPKTSEANPDTDKKSEKKGFFLDGLRNKWQAHVAKNKAMAESRKAQQPATEKVSTYQTPTDAPAVEKAKSTNKKHQELSDEEIDVLFENFDPKKDKKKLTPKLRQKIIEAENLYNEGIVTIKDLISPTSMEVGIKDLKLNDTYIKSLYVYNYPRYLEANWMNPIINFDMTMDISMFIYPSDSGKMMRILRKKVAEMMATKRMNAKKGLVNDVAIDTALEDAEQLRVDLQRGTERFFHMGLYFSIYAEDKEKVDTSSKQLETLLGGQLIMTRPGDFQTERAFETCLPQATDLVDVVRNMNTSPLSTTFPFVSSSLTSDEGILYGLNRHNNSLIIFDRFNLPNANSVVFATSGAGKSYAVKLEILRSMMMGTDVIVIDPENEYENLANTVGGTHFKISLNSDQRINPFDLPLPVDDAEAKPGELLRENVINLLGLINIMFGGLSPKEEGIMDKAILQTYELKGINQETENPHEYVMPTMNDLQNVLSSMEGGKELAIRLEQYTEGTFSGLFSDQTNVDLSSGLIVFCIRDLEERLRPISMYILLNFIWNRVRSKLKRRLLMIDEAWHMVQYEDSGRFLHNLVKRARKYYLGITTITQDVEDFLKSKWGKPIITNSSMQVLLKQAPSSMEVLQKVFNLTEGEKYLLLNSGVGQGLFFAGNQHVAIQIIASYGENKIVTTNPKELLERKEGV